MQVFFQRRLESLSTCCSVTQKLARRFSAERVTQDLIGELNTFRYLPLKDVVIRVLPNDKLVDVLMCITASGIARTPVVVVFQPTMKN